MSTPELDRHETYAVPARLRRTAAPTRRPDLLETIEVIDGRLVVVHPGLRLAPAGTADRTRVNLVLDYLKNRQSELVENGLARCGEPLAVREEFVSYLLNYKLDTLQEEIPQGAMCKFLDEWSHRWI